MVKSLKVALNQLIIQEISKTEDLTVLAVRSSVMVVTMKEVSNRICTRDKEDLCSVQVGFTQATSLETNSTDLVLFRCLKK